MFRKITLLLLCIAGSRLLGMESGIKQSLLENSLYGQSDWTMTKYQRFKWNPWFRDQVQKNTKIIDAALAENEKQLTIHQKLQQQESYKKSVEKGITVPDVNILKARIKRKEDILHAQHLPENVPAYEDPYSLKSRQNKIRQNLLQQSLSADNELLRKYQGHIRLEQKVAEEDEKRSQKLANRPLFYKPWQFIFGSSKAPAKASIRTPESPTFTGSFKETKLKTLKQQEYFKNVVPAQTKIQQQGYARKQFPAMYQKYQQLRQEQVTPSQHQGIKPSSVYVDPY